MRITKVKFQNYTNHAKREDVFPAGVVGIVGPNGAGKSNYLKGIARAFSGKTLNEGKNEDDLSWGADEGGYVQVDFIQDGTAGSIKRNLKSASCSMAFGEQKYRSAEEINAAIYALIGMSPALMSEFVFVGQGELEKIIFAKPAERAKAFQGLFRTEQAEKIREQLDDKIKTIQVISRKADIAAAKEELAALEAQGAALDAERGTLACYIQPAAEVQRLTQLLEAARLYVHNAALVQNLNTEVAHLAQAIPSQEAVVAGLEAQRAEMQKLLTDLTSIYRQAKNAVAGHTAAQQLERTRAHYQQTLQRAEDTLKLAISPEPAEVATIPSLQEQIQELSPSIDTASRVATNFNVLTIQKCPTCQQHVDLKFVEEQKRIAREEGPKLAALRAELVRCQRMASAYQASLAQFNSQRQEATRQKQEAEARLAELPAAKVLSAAELQEYLALCNDYEVTEASLRQAEQGLALARQRLDDFKTRLQTAQARLGQTSLGTPVAPGEESAARAALESHSKAAEADGKLAAQNQFLGTQLKALKAKIESMEAAERKILPAIEFKDWCEQARLLLHRDRLPNVVAQAYLQGINIKLAEYIERFNVPFMAAFNPDLSLSCRFGGAREVPALRLSGGQKAMLGIAFRFAIYDLFVKNLGLMTLDEPTAWLDKDHIDDVFDLLLTVKGYSQGAGLQLVVITHEARLTGVFDHVIQL